MTETEWPSRVWARIAAATAASALAAFFIGRSPALLQALVPLDVATARMTAQVLSWLGMDVYREVAALLHPGGFGYEIAFQCTGIIPAGLLVAAILSAGARWQARVWGAALGALFALIINLVRLVSLFYIGVQFPAAFEVAHSVLWQGLTVLALLGFFWEWRHYALPASSPAGQHSRLKRHLTRGSIREGVPCGAVVPFQPDL